MTSVISTKTEIEPTWVDEVIRFWFEELRSTQWFKKSDAVDEQIRARFLTLREDLVAQEGAGATALRPILGTVIVLDQFSRNLFRDSPGAFAADSIARRLSSSAIQQSLDTRMNREERYFLYLPFEHSEDRQDQALALNLIQQLGNEQWTRFAVAHKLIIDRFGRFPHRNAVLGRPSTEAEMTFLKEPMSSF
jgi:uncharacterized protein (DUF924 family)